MQEARRVDGMVVKSFRATSELETSFLQWYTIDSAISCASAKDLDIFLWKRLTLMSFIFSTMGYVI